MESASYNAGWNDVLAAIRKSQASVEKKDLYLNTVKAELKATSNDKECQEFVKGAKDAATAILERRAVEYRGSDDLVKQLKLEEYQ